MDSPCWTDDVFDAAVWILSWAKRVFRLARESWPLLARTVLTACHNPILVQSGQAMIRCLGAPFVGLDFPSLGLDSSWNRLRAAHVVRCVGGRTVAPTQRRN